MTLTAEKEAALKTLAGDPALLQRFLDEAAQTDKAAQTQDAVFKEAPAWAQQLIADVQALKAAPPFVAETEAKASAAEMEGGDAAGADDELADAEEAGDAEMEAMLEAIADRVVQKLAPLLDMEKKVGGYLNEMKGMLGGTAQKDDARAEEMATLKARLDELAGVPSPKHPGGVRATASKDNLTTKEVVEALMPRADPDADFLKFIVSGQ